MGKCLSSLPDWGCMFLSRGLLGQLSLCNLPYPMALSLSPWLSLEEMPLGTGAVLASSLQGKLCPCRGKVCLLTQ